MQDVYSDDPRLVRYVTEPQRGAFLDMLPISSDSVVFELGPGLGQFTSTIASRARAVYALEVIPQQAAFTLIRCRQEGRHHVAVAAGGSDCNLPYQSDSFDVAILNLVFEWCGSRDMSRPVEEAQAHLLREVNRILKQGGVMYVNTKNRFSLSSLLGKTEGYARPFANLLPNRLAEIVDPYIRMKSKIRSRLYSHNGLARLLHQHGFTDVQSYWAAPEMRYPDRLIPNETKAIREARRAGGFRQGEVRRTQMLMPWVPAGLVKHITTGLTFTATKSSAV